MFTWLYDRLFPDDRPDNVRLWRLTVSQILILLVAFAAFSFAAMTTGLPVTGELVWSKDVEQKVDKTAQPIRGQVEQIKRDIEKISDEQAEQRALLIAQLASAKASEIRLLTYKRCKATTYADRERLNSEIDDAQIEYRQLTGERYVPPTCGEL